MICINTLVIGHFRVDECVSKYRAAVAITWVSVRCVRVCIWRLRYWLALLAIWSFSKCTYSYLLGYLHLLYMIFVSLTKMQSAVWMPKWNLPLWGSANCFFYGHGRRFQGAPLTLHRGPVVISSFILISRKRCAFLLVKQRQNSHSRASEPGAQFIHFNGKLKNFSVLSVSGPKESFLSSIKCILMTSSGSVSCLPLGSTHTWMRLNHLLIWLFFYWTK